MSGLTCQNADGTKQGGVCDATGKCDPKSNLVCNTSTGLCDLTSDGKIGSPCQGDTLKCLTDKYPGITCSSKDATKPGTCVCGTPAMLCDDNKICATGSAWPDATFPNPTDDERSKFTGNCTASSWYTTAKGNCNPGFLGGKDSNGNVACIDPKNWTASLGAGYSNFCLA